MALTFMVQTDKGNLVGRNNEGWKANKFNFWHYNTAFMSQYYDGTRFELTAEELLDLVTDEVSQLIFLPVLKPTFIMLWTHYHQTHILITMN